MLSAVVISLALCASTAFGQSVCGQTPVAPNLNSKFDNEIVGGSNALPYSWPWQIVWCRTSGSSCSLMCGGSVIDNNWIMTAAHCARGQNAANIKIKAGVFNEASTTEQGMQMIQVAEIHIHPNYNPSTMVYDIALARLSQPLAYSEHIQPVCLPSSDSGVIGIASNYAYVTGWGTTSSGGSISQTLRQVRVPYVPFTTCNSASEYHGQINQNTMICAGVGGKDSCQGDSGGPLVTQSGSQWYQYGIVSWGIGCAQSNHPGIYSRVTAFCSFISSTTGGAANCR